MRRGAVLLALAGAAAVLAVCLAFLQPEAAPAVPEAPETPAYRMLYERPSSDFVSLTVTLPDGGGYTVDSSLVFDADGTLLGVRNALGQPVTVRGSEGFALDTVAWQMMELVSRCLPVTASYAALDPEACGLESPAARVEIRYREGEAIGLSVGRLTSGGASCYAALDGDSRVYLVPADFYQVMTRPLQAQHRLPGALERKASDAVQIALVDPQAGQLIATCHGGEGRLLPWQVDQPVSHSGSTERIEAFIEGVCAIRADAYEATVTEAEGLRVYGLDRPVRLIVAFGDGVIRDVHLGADAGEGRVYARLDSSGDVYLVSRTQLAFREQTEAADLLDRFIALVPARELARAEISSGGRRWTLRPEDETFSKPYTALIGLQFDKLAPADFAPEELLLQADFERTDGQRMSVGFFACNDDYVFAETSGGGRFLMRAERLEQLLEILKEEQP